jgi:hypothetical protein
MFAIFQSRTQLATTVNNKHQNVSSPWGVNPLNEGLTGICKGMRWPGSANSFVFQQMDWRNTASCG